jgi:hypothetical protein
LHENKNDIDSIGIFLEGGGVQTARVYGLNIFSKPLEDPLIKANGASFFFLKKIFSPY